MSKIIVALIAALAFSPAGCSSPTTTPTGCVATRPVTVPDAGATGSQCLVLWSCDSDTQHYQIQCILLTEGSMAGNYSCYCTTDTTTLATTIVVNSFSCDFQGGALPVAAQCGWMLSM